MGYIYRHTPRRYGADCTVMRPAVFAVSVAAGVDMPLFCFSFSVVNSKLCVVSVFVFFRNLLRLNPFFCLVFNLFHSFSYIFNFSWFLLITLLSLSLYPLQFVPTMHFVYYSCVFFFLSSFLHPSPTSCLLYTSPSPRDRQKSRMPSSA